MLIIAGAVAAYVIINNNKNNGNKRSIAVREIPWSGDKPVAQVYAQSKIVIPGVDYEGDSKAPLSKFAGSDRVRGLPPKAQRRYVIDWTLDDDDK